MAGLQNVQNVQPRLHSIGRAGRAGFKLGSWRVRRGAARTANRDCAHLLRVSLLRRRGNDLWLCEGPARKSPAGRSSSVRDARAGHEGATDAGRARHALSLMPMQIRCDLNSAELCARARLRLFVFAACVCERVHTRHTHMHMRHARTHTRTHARTHANTPRPSFSPRLGPYASRIPPLASARARACVHGCTSGVQPAYIAQHASCSTRAPWLACCSRSMQGAACSSAACVCCL